MAANVKREREDGTILVTNVGTAKAAGKLIVVGELVCMHKNDQAISATNCPVFVKDVEILYAKLETDVATEGCKLYYDDTNDYLTVTVGTDPVLKYAGIAAAAAGSTATTCRCHLGLKR
jgi:predicted RecA/RadA family phage recombinase